MEALEDFHAEHGDEPVPLPHVHRGPGLWRLVRLFWYRGEQILQHSVTGERCILPSAAGPWRLFSEGEWCYVKDSQGRVEYVTDLLSSSVWQHEGELYIQSINLHGVVVTTWVSEAISKHSRHYASWRANKIDVSVPRLAHNIYEVPRDGARVFIDVADAQAVLGFCTKYAASREWLDKASKTWLRKAADFDIPASHFIHPLFDGGGPLGVGKMHVSSKAMVWILLHGSVTMKDQYDRGRCLRFLRSFLNRFVPSLDVTFVEGEMTFNGDPINEASGYRFTHDGDKFAAAEGFPPPCLRLLHGHDLTGAVERAWALRERNAWVIVQLLGAIGLAVDTQLSESRWPTDPLKCLTSRGGLRPLCLHSKAALANLPMAVARNTYRANKIMKVLGFKAATHNHLVDHAWCRRYVYASRKNNHEATSWGISNDKSRGSGKDWLRGVILPYESGVPGWTQPLVSPASKIIKRTSPTSQKFVCKALRSLPPLLRALAG